MSVLTILIDTNVLIDFLIDREPFTKNAGEIIKKSQDKVINAYLAAHSITNIFYILRKIYSVTERKQRLLDLCRIISVVNIGYELVLNALSNNDLDDVEDCLQAECANVIKADYIVTRNIKDFSYSKVPVILPENLLKLLESSDLR